MIRWSACGYVCAVVIVLGARGGIRADEPTGGREPKVKSQEPEQRAKDATRVPSRDAAVRSAIEKVLGAQQEAWNAGDVRAFMDHYWKSDDLTFSSGGKTTRGWQATLARYRERYPTREQMGRLSLGGLEITPLGDAAAFVLGKWKLDRQGEPAQGNFTLVLRKIEGRWAIVHDHTSRLGNS